MAAQQKKQLSNRFALIGLYFWIQRNNCISI